MDLCSRECFAYKSNLYFKISHIAHYRRRKRFGGKGFSPNKERGCQLELTKHKSTKIYLAALTAFKAEVATADIMTAVPRAPIILFSLNFAGWPGRAGQ